jgi:hypothetical protein
VPLDGLCEKGELAMFIDTSFDFRRDTPPGKDPDVRSPTLRQYHKLLWSKLLPNGRPFTLEDSVRGHYLHHRSDVGEFSLASDAVIPSFTRWGFAAKHPELFTKEENEAFMTVGYTNRRHDGLSGHPGQWQADHQCRPRVQQEDRGSIRSHA